MSRFEKRGYIWAAVFVVGMIVAAYVAYQTHRNLGRITYSSFSGIGQSIIRELTSVGEHQLRLELGQHMIWSLVAHEAFDSFDPTAIRVRGLESEEDVSLQFQVKELLGDLYGVFELGTGVGIPEWRFEIMQEGWYVVEVLKQDQTDDISLFVLKDEISNELKLKFWASVIVFILAGTIGLMIAYKTYRNYRG